MSMEDAFIQTRYVHCPPILKHIISIKTIYEIESW